MRGWIFIFLSTLIFSCSHEVKKERIVEVSTYVVEPKTLPIILTFVGVCESSHLVEIYPRVEGYLQKVEYTEGEFVENGQVLFSIDPREFETNVAEVKANLQKEEAILWSTRKAVDRYEPLYEKKAASLKDLEDAKAQFLAQQATVNYYKAKLEETELKLGYTQIVSPISGFTTRTRYQEGTYINPASSEPMTSVSVLDPIWVNVNVSDAYFLESSREIAEGRLSIPEDFDFEVKLILADGTEYPYSGKVSFISPVLDVSTGTLSTRGVFPNPDYLLKPGQFVRAKLSGAEWVDAVFVPQSAVVQGDEGRFVYLVSNGGRVEKRNVVTGSWYDDVWIIKSGLKKGDEVISQGVNKVREGMIVKVTNRSSHRKSASYF